MHIHLPTLWGLNLRNTNKTIHVMTTATTTHATVTPPSSADDTEFDVSFLTCRCASAKYEMKSMDFLALHQF